LAPGNKIGYKIPFPVAMDTLLKVDPLTDDSVMDFIEANFPDFRSYVAKEKESIYERVKQYLKLKQFSAQTFEEYGLRGTPSAILIDKKGVLRQTFFGSDNSLEGTVKQLLNETC
jgi:hypothetical protein